MTDTYKVLGQSLGGSVTAVNGTPQDSVLYTVPSATQAAISAIIITNTGESAVNYSVGVVTYGDSTAVTDVLGESVLAFSGKHTIIPAHTLEVGSTEEIKGGVTLSSGDQLLINSTSTSIVAHAYGAEIV